MISDALRVFSLMSVSSHESTHIRVFYPGLAIPESEQMAITFGILLFARFAKLRLPLEAFPDVFGT